MRDTFKTYYSLTKPGIVYGNVLTATAGFFVAAAGHVDWTLLLATLAGTSLVVASACVVNNYLDRNIDKVMARTGKRALVTGALPMRNALIYAAVLGAAGFAILIVWVNWLTVLLGFIGYVAYIVAYGWGKRNTVYGTLIGSVSGAIPPVAGYTAVTNQLDAAAFLLFAILVVWQMPHFYAIAIYRRKDYAAAKLPVLPVKKSIATAQTHILLFIAIFFPVTMQLFLSGHAGSTYFVLVELAALSWVVMSVCGLSTDKPEVWARRVFWWSLIVILVFCIACVLDSFLR